MTRDTSIQQLLREEEFFGGSHIQAWYKGTKAPVDMKIKSGGSLRITCSRVSGNDEISPTIPFQVDDEENNKAQPNSRWSHITTQPGPQASAAKMQVFIKGSDGPTHCATVEPHHTIQQIAERFLPGNINFYKAHYGARLLDMQMTVVKQTFKTMR